MNKKCEHGKREQYCKNCGGASICKHDKRKDRCKECGGSSLCIHDVEKSQCKKCHGAGICEHNRERRRCSVCDTDGTFKKCKVGAIERSLSFSLSLTEFEELVIQPCSYCGENREPRGIDRWNNSIGYEKSNCVSCCFTCNFAKKKMLGSDFISMCRRVAKTHQGE